MQERFGDLKGQLLLAEVMGTFSQPHPTVVRWFNEFGERNIIKSEDNRPIQRAVVEKYKRMILEKGLSQGVAGEPWFQYQEGRSFPVKALTWGHRTEAFYLAHAEDPKTCT